MDKSHPAPGAAPMGLALFLVSLAVLFAASLVAYAAVRFSAPDWPPPGMPRLPQFLWVSTVILMVSSGTMHWALRGVRRGDQGALQKGMALTTFLGFLFLLSQLVNWKLLLDLEVTVQRNLYGFTFYLLTALHGLHIVGGLIPMVVTTVRSTRRRYTAEAHQGVQLCAMYWHFLDGVWLVMFVALVILA